MSNEQNSKELQNALFELKSINRIIDKICRISETNHIMTIIINELINLTDSSQGVVNLISRMEEKDDLVTVVRRQQNDPNEIPYKVHNIITGWVLKEKRILKVDDLDGDERFKSLDSEEGRYKSLLCCPMVVRGEIIGITTLIKDKAHGLFTEDQSRLVGIIVSQSAQILSNAILLKELAGQKELLEISYKKLKDDNLRLQSEIGSTFAFENIIGKSEAIKKVLMLASKVSGNDSPVLITGPTGTGKELVARAIHYNSGRRERGFTVKNCGVKTESLLEAELFGCKKGAFTGADRDKPGLFKEADGGTIFLDEIGDAPLSTQMAVLRVIETGEIRPVGASKTEYVDVRIISATNKDLSAAIGDGSFRQDLYYRLNTFTIEIPSLKRRAEDIPLLVNHFLGKLGTKLGLDNPAVTPAALDILCRYSWPGNVRQLENELERAAVISEAGGLIDTSDLSTEILGAAAGEINRGAGGRLRDIVERVEREIISATLNENDGNILRTSKILGLTRKGLKDKMARYGLTADGD